MQVAYAKEQEGQIQTEEQAEKGDSGTKSGEQKKGGENEPPLWMSLVIAAKLLEYQEEFTMRKNPKELWKAAES